jgi:competence protein ComGC
MDNQKRELVNKLKSKIREKQIYRSSSEQKEHILDSNFKKMGIDKERYMDDLKKLKKQGGFTEEQKNSFLNKLMLQK